MKRWITLAVIVLLAMFGAGFLTGWSWSRPPTIVTRTIEVEVVKTVEVNRWAPRLDFEHVDNMTVEDALLFIAQCRWSHQYYVDNPSTNPVIGSPEFNQRLTEKYDQLAKLLRQYAYENTESR